jgi:hypothetical protein
VDLPEIPISSKALAALWAALRAAFATAEEQQRPGGPRTPQEAAADSGQTEPDLELETPPRPPLPGE